VSNPNTQLSADTVWIDLGVCLRSGRGGSFFYQLSGAPHGTLGHSGNAPWGGYCDELDAWGVRRLPSFA